MRSRIIWIVAIAAALADGAATADAQEGKEAAVRQAEQGLGAELFNKRCAQCHSLEKGKNGNGPSLYGIVDRRAAVVPGFKYSRALRQMAADKDLTWNEENLAAFLGRPSLLVPGTRMAFPGVKDEEGLIALVEWIKANSGPPSGNP